MADSRSDGIDVVLQGNTFEGGGGLIRDSLTYSTLLNKAIRIESIRAGRPGPGGLRSEHTVAIRTMSFLCNANMEGNIAESQTLTFIPYQQQKKGLQEEPHNQLDLELKGAASISIIALLPFLLFSHLSASPDASRQVSPHGISLKVRAGTLAVKAPSYHYVLQVLLPTLNMIGLGGHVELGEEYVQGWHTALVMSRGLMTAWVKPLEKALPAFQLLGRGKVIQILATGTVPPQHASQFEAILHAEIEAVFISEAGSLANSQHPVLTIKVEPSNQPTQYHLLIAVRTTLPEAYLGYEQVYPQANVGFPSELEGDEKLKLTHLARVCIRGIVEELETGSAVDDHMSDILIPYQALASGRSTVAMASEEGRKMENGVFSLGGIDERYHIETASMHKKTSHWVTEKMTGVTFERLGSLESCEGIALGSIDSVL